MVEMRRILILFSLRRSSFERVLSSQLQLPATRLQMALTSSEPPQSKPNIREIHN